MIVSVLLLIAGYVLVGCAGFGVVRANADEFIVNGSNWRKSPEAMVVAFIGSVMVAVGLTESGVPSPGPASSWWTLTLPFAMLASFLVILAGPSWVHNRRLARDRQRA